MAVMTLCPTGAEECVPFFEPLPRGSEVIAEYECICNYDPFDTGLEERKNGCGGIYYRRFYIYQGIVHNERTACQCVQDWLRENEIDTDFLEVQEKVQKYWGNWDMFRDEAYFYMTLSRYQAETEKQQKALQFLQGWEPKKKMNILLCGRPGRGKTHLAIATIRPFRKQKTILGLKSIDLLNRLRKLYQNSRDDGHMENEVISTLKKVDILLIDDIGAEKPTGWVLEKLYEIIDARLNRRHTFFTSNLNGVEMENRLGAALTSRINSGAVFVIDGQDKRLGQDIWADLGTELEEW